MLVVVLQEINRATRPDLTAMQSTDPENKHKNRYINILACKLKKSLENNRNKNFNKVQVRLEGLTRVLWLQMTTVVWY